jgi:hypothetical protein
MPTNLPTRPLPLLAQLMRKWRELSDDQTELLIVMSFALSPLAVLLFLIFLAGPQRMSYSSTCDELQCSFEGPSKGPQPSYD